MALPSPITLTDAAASRVKAISRKTNKEIISESDKQITKTSANFPEASGGGKGTRKITIVEYNEDFDKLSKLITPEQELELLSGKDVFVLL